MHKDTRWARQLILLQGEDGKWGNFHSLSSGSTLPVTTEQALRRLERLGFTAEDDCIRKALTYMHSCLAGEREIPDRREKLHDWDIFTSMILSAWIRRFTKDDPLANAAAARWAAIITAAFASGEYDAAAYATAYLDIFGQRPRGGRLIDFSQFYLVSMLREMLDPRTERAFVRHILNHPRGIYYVWEKPLTKPPEFRSLAASRYLAALELLADYKRGKEQLGFAVRWLEENRGENSRWDMGPKVRDGMYFPLSDSWRRKEDREADCTERISALVAKILS